MENVLLTGINIRSALELNIPINDVFKVNVAPEGNPVAKDFYYSHDKKSMINEILPLFDGEEYMAYSDIKIPQSINDSLKCYIYNDYFIYKNDYDSKEFKCEKSFELIFVNTEVLSFDKFCENIMEAQAFSGNFEKNNFNHHFIGVGDFDLEDYLPINNLIANSNLNLIKFYVYHKKVMSSIGYFICGLFEKDVRDQRKYLSDSEYRDMIKLVRTHKKNILNSFRETEQNDSEGFF